MIWAGGIVAIIHSATYGEEGIREVVAQAALRGEDAKGLCLCLVEAAMRLSGGVHEDDVTVVVARRR